MTKRRKINTRAIKLDRMNYSNFVGGIIAAFIAILISYFVYSEFLSESINVILTFVTFAILYPFFIQFTEMALISRDIKRIKKSRTI